MYFISNEELTSHLDSEGDLTLMLPGFNKTFSSTQAKLTSSEVEVDSVIGIVETYMGNIDSEEGYVLISAVEDHLAGVVQTASHFYEILPINESVSILREQDISHTPVFNCGSGGETQEEDPKEVEVNTTITSASCDPPEICTVSKVDVLVLLTPQVPLWYGANTAGWEGIIHLYLGLATAQMAANNSEFFSVNYRFHFGGVIPFASSGNDMENDINAIKDGIGGALREAYHADLVLVISSNPVYTLAGVVNDIEDTPCLDCGYAMVDVATMLGPNWVLAHEVGHLFAARHNWSANISAGCAASGCSDDTDICGHAFRFSTSATMNQTVVSRGGTPGTPILGYSNPDVTFGGIPTGIAPGVVGVESDNVTVMRNSACTVKNYFPDPYFSVNICCPPSFFCENDNSFQLSAMFNEAAPVMPGHPPYSVQWEVLPPWGGDPNDSPVTLVGSGTSGSQNFNINGVGPVNIKVTVTSSDGVVVSDSKSINIFDENSSSCFHDGGGENRQKKSNDEKSLSFADFQIHPNPFTSTTKLVWPADYNGTPHFMLLNAQGEIIKNFDNLEKFNNTLDLESISTGVYFLHIQDENGSTIKRIVKQNL